MLRKPVSSLEVELYIELLKDFYPEKMTSAKLISKGLADVFNVKVSINDIDTIINPVSESLDEDTMLIYKNNV